MRVRSFLRLFARAAVTDAIVPKQRIQAVAEDDPGAATEG